MNLAPRALVESLIRDVVDFPAPGVVFKDITPLLDDPRGFAAAVDMMVEPWVGAGVSKVLGIEARGFMLATPIAQRLAVGFVPVRKPGKLPAATVGLDYDLEYGTDRVEMHADALVAGEQVLIVDDVLATGGTAAATARLVDRVGAEVVGFAMLIELASLGGRARLGGARLEAVVTVEG